MPAYWDLDSVLMTMNKDHFLPGEGVEGGHGVVRPGDEVVVATADRRTHSILVHSIDPATRLCRGETRERIDTGSGGAMVEEGNLVHFSWKKIAGIHRRGGA